MRYFITGFHRSGSRSCAEYLSKNYIEEEQIGLNNIKKALRFNGVIHCPGLAHRAIDLSKHGIVYWCDRASDRIINSMKVNLLEKLAKQVLREFGHSEGEADPIKALIEIKSRVYWKEFKFFCNYILLEEQPYYGA